MKKKVITLAAVATMLAGSVFVYASPRQLAYYASVEEGTVNCPPTPNAECYSWASGNKSCFHGGGEHSLNCQP